MRVRDEIVAGRWSRIHIFSRLGPSSSNASEKNAAQRLSQDEEEEERTEEAVGRARSDDEAGG